MYNPESHQWRLYWANKKVGILDPPQVGEFKDGVGEFFAQDTINGKTILIKFHWTNLTTTPHFEQSFSDDVGKTSQVNWITDQTRGSDGQARFEVRSLSQNRATTRRSSVSPSTGPSPQDRRGSEWYYGNLGIDVLKQARSVSPSFQDDDA